MTYTEAEAKQIFDIMNSKSDNKSVGTVNTAQLTYAESGVWDLSGANQDVINNYMSMTGLRARLPFFPTSNQNPIWFTLQGIKDNGQAPPEGKCENAPNGYMKGCAQIGAMGHMQFDSNDMIFGETHLYDNEGVNRNLRLVGNPINPQMPTINGLPPAQAAFNNVVAKEMMQVGMLYQSGTNPGGGVQSQLGHNRELWQGDPANNTSGGGYKEYPGLDLQINTGIIDAQTGALCPAMDSQVRDFGLQQLDVLGVNTIVRFLSEMEMNLVNISRGVQLPAVEWIVCMTPQLWVELTAIYPIAYNTNRGDSFLASTGFVGNVDAVAMQKLVDDMRNSMTIKINARTYQVVLDDGIFEGNNANTVGLNAGQFSSSIYFVPLKVGGVPVTFIEFNDYQAAFAELGVLGTGRDKLKFWTDGGMYSWALSENTWCYRLHAKTEQRLLLTTPQLSGRVDDVMYQPGQHLRSADPTSPYFVDGGVSTRPPSSNKQAVWAN